MQELRGRLQGPLGERLPRPRSSGHREHLDGVARAPQSGTGIAGGRQETVCNRWPCRDKRERVAPGEL